MSIANPTRLDVIVWQYSAEGHSIQALQETMQSAFRELYDKIMESTWRNPDTGNRHVPVTHVIKTFTDFGITIQE